MTLEELSAREIYDTYANNREPASLIDEGRTALATRLRVVEGLAQRDAYYAADQILVYARQLVEGQSS